MESLAISLMFSICRFGPEIAYAAQSCLEFSNVDNDRLTLVGGRNKDKLINRDEITNARDFKPIAIVARTNLGLFNEVVRLVCETEKPPASCFAGGIKNCNFDDLRDIYYLAVEEKHKMKEGWKKRFKTLDSFEAFVTNINDIEMIGKIKTVKKYGNRLPNLLNKIEKHCKSDPKTADYVFTTAHKAKGLEWKTVVLMDDFADLRDGLLTPEEVFLIRDNDNDEMNLLYVAMTRAKKYLVLNHVILNLLVSRGDFSDKVISNRGGEKEHFVCGDCRANVAKEDNVLQLTRNSKTFFKYYQYFDCSPFRNLRGFVHQEFGLDLFPVFRNRNPTLSASRGQLCPQQKSDISEIRDRSSEQEKQRSSGPSGQVRGEHLARRCSTRRPRRRSP